MIELSALIRTLREAKQSLDLNPNDDIAKYQLNQATGALEDMRVMIDVALDGKISNIPNELRSQAS